MLVHVPHGKVNLGHQRRTIAFTTVNPFPRVASSCALYEIGRGNARLLVGGGLVQLACADENGGVGYNSLKTCPILQRRYFWSPHTSIYTC